MGYEAQTKAVNTQAAIIQAQPPTLTIDCSTGCGNAKIDYLDPRDRHQLKIPHVTGTNDTIIGVMPNVVTGLGYVAGAVSAIRIFDDAFSSSGGNNTEVHNNSNIVGDDNVNNQDAQTSKADNNTSHSEANQANQANQQNQDNDVTNTDVANDKSTTDRNDTVNNDDNSVTNNDDNSVDNTATPTVVDPVIVTPVVVQPDVQQ